MRLLIILFFLLTCTTACNTGDIVYRDIVDIDVNGWKPAQELRLSTKISDTAQLYDVWLYVRHNTDYSWRNLFIFLKTYYPDHTYSCDTIECMLAEASGKWLGSGMGFKRENQWLLKKVKFPQTGTYIFEFTQGMRDENLKNIENIGMKIMKSE